MPNDQFFNEFVIDPSTGQTIRIPTAMGFGMGLPQAQPPPDEVYPPESDGAGPPIDHGSLWQQPTIPQHVIDTANREAAIRAHAALPENVRNGTYDTYDPSDFQEPSQPVLAQRGGMSLGPRGGGVAHLTQSTGPLGTIDQIGQAYARDPYGRSPQGQYATQADLDGALFDQQTAIPSLPTPRPYDPNQPEQAGADLYQQSLAMQERAVQANAAADAQAAAAESRARAEAAAREQAIQAQAERDRAAAQARFRQAQSDVQRKTDSWVNYHVEQNRKWHQASTGSKIGVAIAVAMSALGDALQYKSGPNGALQIINQANEDDVNAQIEERQHLGDVANRARSSLDDYRQEFGDLALAKQGKLAENEKRLANEIQQQTSMVSGQKARATTLGTIGALRAQAAEREQNIAMTVFNRREQQRQNQAQLGVSYANLKLSRDQFTWTKDKQQQDLNLQAQQLAAAGDAAKAKLIMERGIGGVPTPVLDAQGNPVLDAAGVPKVKQDVLRNRDKTEFIPQGSPASVDKLRDAKAATDTLVQLMDEAMRIRTGWTSDSAKSAEWLRLKANWGAAKAVAKDVLGLGAPSGKDMELVDGFIGSDDPSQYRDPSEGIKKARQNVLTMFNSKAHAAGLDGDYDPPNLSGLGAPKTTPEQEDFKYVMKDPISEVSGKDKDMQSLAANIGIDGSPEWQNTERDPSARVALLRKEFRKRDSLLPAHRDIMDSWAATLADPSAKQGDKDRALGFLTDVERSAQTPGAKTYARQLLTANATTGAQLTPETFEPATSVAHDIPAGGPATTMSGQIANEQMYANALKAMPLAPLVDKVNKGDAQAASELSQRAMAKGADPAAMRAYMRWIGTRK